MPLTSLRKYERITEDKEKAVSKILTGEKESYNEAILKNPDEEKHVSPISSTSDVVVGSSNLLPVPSSDIATSSSGPPDVPGRYIFQYNNCTVNMYSSPQPMSYNPLNHYYPQPFHTILFLTISFCKYSFA
jgi:hypothetical protein